MHAPREQAQHAGCVPGVGWLAEYRFIDPDNCVCPEHAVPRPRAPDCERLLASQSLRARAWRFARQHRLVDIRGLHGERNPRVAQQFLASRRSRSENEHGLLILLRTCSRIYLLPTTPRTDSISLAES